MKVKYAAAIGMIQALPDSGEWTQRERDEFIRVFGVVLDFYLEISDPPPPLKATAEEEK